MVSDYTPERLKNAKDYLVNAHKTISEGSDKDLVMEDMFFATYYRFLSDNVDLSATPSETVTENNGLGNNGTIKEQLPSMFGIVGVSTEAALAIDKCIKELDLEIGRLAKDWMAILVIHLDRLDAAAPGCLFMEYTSMVTTLTTMSTNFMESWKAFMDGFKKIVDMV